METSSKDPNAHIMTDHFWSSIGKLIRFENKKREVIPC